MNLFDAISQKILPSPNYIIGLSNLEDTKKEYLAAIQKAKISPEEKKRAKQELQNIKVDWQKSSNIEQIIANSLDRIEGKFIIFCENIEHLETMSKSKVGIKELFRKAGQIINQKVKPNIYMISTDERQEAIKNNLCDFENKTTGLHLLLCVNMLNEGVHLKDIDGIIMLRNTASPNIFYQQLGRCLSIDLNKTPVVFDFVANIDSMGNFESQLRESIYKENNERKTLGLEPTTVSVSFTDKTIDIRERLQKLNDSFKLALQSFDQWLLLLMEYKNLNGDCLVKRDYIIDGVKLGVWVSRQRIASKKGTLSQDKIDQLNGIGFVWDKYEVDWQQNFALTKRYVKENGNCLIKRDYIINGVKLGLWVNRQRIASKKGTLSQDKIDQLNSIGFVWVVKK